ncbi:MAG TPA: hypothetical protein VI389_01150 [Geobacteraceae bacterium]
MLTGYPCPVSIDWGGVMPHALKKLIASLLVVVTVVATSFCLCTEAHARHAEGIHGQETGDVTVAAAVDHCPSCPESEHTGADHCDCACSCHLPVTVQPVHIRFSPAITLLIVSEPFNALPEVYLPKFVPPQNLA